MTVRAIRYILPPLVLAIGACVCTSNFNPEILDVIQPTETTPTATPVPIPTQVPVLSTDTLAEIEKAEIPTRDRFDLAARFLGKTGVPTSLPNPTHFQVGDTRDFWIDNNETQTSFTVRGRMVASGQHVAMWVEDGVFFDQAAMDNTVGYFDQTIYPNNRAIFGSEPLPGIDGDERVNIFNGTSLGSGVGGYFNSPSEYPASIVPNSNEMEVIYVNMLYLSPGDGSYEAVVAHEFQHMIHWNVDANEESWMNEGMSELASYINGYGLSSATGYFLNDPDLQLNAWPEFDDTTPHYGAGFLFNAYFLDRFGEHGTRALVSDPGNGLAGVDGALEKINAGVTADQVFGDWIVANLLNDTSIASGQYGYREVDYSGDPAISEYYADYPVKADLQVYQYGTDYIELRGPATLGIHFEGGKQVRIFPANTFDTDSDPATDDRFVWWSNRADDSDTTLTRDLDLSGVSEARLDFDLWYWIEDGWDFGYVEVSTDGGRTWMILATEASSDFNPHHNAYGVGYTGSSADQAGADDDGWLRQSVDLSEYIGKRIKLRFEVITDDATNQPGLVIDNICVSAINWCDDVEDGVGDWEASGFVRVDNILPQRYLVQVIAHDDDGAKVVLPFVLDDQNTGDLAVEIGGGESAFLVVSGLTRYTTEPAPYRIEITEMP